MSTVSDAPQRVRAADPLGSFCVSAPAGSGKTELLIQRYLALLPRVERPEQVLAITFTRKAAAEMRERVMQALRLAADNVPVESDHQHTTRQLALAALEADRRGHWQLLADVSRLNIKTIDSFCLSLARQMPVLSLFGGQAAPVDDAAALYEEAVSELFAMLDSDHPVSADIKALLSLFHNKWERVSELLVDILARRSQWEPYIDVRNDPKGAEEYLVDAIQRLVHERLSELSERLVPWQGELLDLMQYAAGNLDQDVPAQFPGSEPADIASWRAMRGMLMTNKGTWRASPNINQGFPPQAASEEAAARLAQVRDLLETLGAVEDLEPALHEVALLPEFGAGETSWRMVVHLSRLLPVLAAQLLLVFGRRGAVDHTQVALSALDALGDEDAPTDLALRLDYRIEHLLVDEFQDTSTNQFKLVCKLTRGWPEHNAANPDNPRTLMVVGDAMQSIYGFRDANVGLFFKARDEGFNGLVLQPVQLESNFRSDSRVIDWVNTTFKSVFPQQDDIATGQVKYSPAVAVRPAGEGTAVELNGFVGEGAKGAEVAFICDAIAQQVAAGETDIAVLGRQRRHLQDVGARLKTLGVPFQAQELESLAASSVVADLLNLCRALANDADRVAWLAVLRAPWCGLGLADLLQVGRFTDGEQDRAQWSIYPVLHAPELLALLTAEGAERVVHVRNAMDLARAKRDRLSLRAWIELVWVSLGGAAATRSEIERQDVESFMRLLEQADSQGIGFDTRWLDRRVERQFMSGGDADSPVQLMTLHKAKGLEFNRVYIPRLDGSTRSNARDLLLWDEHSDPQGGTSFLIAADDRSDSGTPSLYHFLRELRRQKQLHEAIRLIYVGATRAVNHLHLSAAIGWNEKKEEYKPPSPGSLLACLWHVFEKQMARHDVDEVSAEEEHARPLVRLAAGSLPQRYFELEKLSEGNVPERADNFFERVVGTAVHLALEELSMLPTLPDRAGEADLVRWRHALQDEGLYGEQLDAATERLRAAVDTTLADSAGGRWVLDSTHPQAHSEWALSCASTEGDIAGTKNIVIDRCFVDGQRGERWVVDYKTSSPAPGESREDFLQRESESYRGQLQHYRDAVRELGDEPIRCGLYFTSLGHLHELEALALNGDSKS